MSEEKSKGKEVPPESLEEERLVSVLESLLFVCDTPLTMDQMKKVLGEEDRKVIEGALDQIRELYGDERGVMLEEIAGGFQFRTKPQNAFWIKQMIKIRPVRLSHAAMEVLAIVAYRQPITRADIEQIRGVDCGGVLRGLMERDLVKTIGKLDEPGRPILYGTSKNFLEVFGLRKISELPPLKEIQELTPEESEKLQRIHPLSKEEMEQSPHEPGFMGVPENEEERM